MKNRKYFYAQWTIISLLIIMSSCNNESLKYDASGVFETTEIVVSSEASGKVINLNFEEGNIVEANAALGCVDTTQLYLNKMQLISNKKATELRSSDIPKQIGALQQQIATQRKEKSRFIKLVNSNAANQKQVDDIDNQILTLEKQLAAQKQTLSNANQQIVAESEALEIQINQVDDKIKKSIITSPISGTILSKYVELGEYTLPGKALFKVADIQNMFLRTYITSNQLSKIKVGKSIKVYADFGDSSLKEYNGVVSWISDKSEFTPKTIQTKDERANQVYAVKIAVKNIDGLLKKGMYGEIKIENTEK